MRIALASVRFPNSLEDGLEQVKTWMIQAAEQSCDLICFPEAYLPGMRDQGWDVPAYDHAKQQVVLEEVRKAAESNGISVILGMEWQSEIGLHNVAFVISGEGEILGYQAKNQIPPEEEKWYVPSGKRRLFQIGELVFGIAICHEGWRYPETVRWAASRGAHIVFHPQFTGSAEPASSRRVWGDPDAPYYEKAMLCRSIENIIYFASVNYALPNQDSATSLISPEGTCLGHVPYGEEGLLVHEIDIQQATGVLAKRYAPHLYQEELVVTKPSSSK